MKKILYIGRIATYKGVHYLIKAMPQVVKHHPEASLLIRGQISTGKLGNYHKKILLLLKNLAIKNKIKYFPGWISESEKRKLIKEADVIVCPSLCSEGFGLIPLEVLKLNGILVCSDLFVETGAVNDRVAFVYPRNSVKGLAEQIIKALDLSPSQLEEKRKRARKWISQFSWSRHINELEKVFLDLINKEKKLDKKI